jgi:hypothetical protein
VRVAVWIRTGLELGVSRVGGTKLMDSWRIQAEITEAIRRRHDAAHTRFEQREDLDGSAGWDRTPITRNRKRHMDELA